MLPPLAIALLLVAPLAGPALEPADAILGVWATKDSEAHVEIYERDGLYYGKFVDFEDEVAKDGRDVKNPDPALRDRLLLGSDFILGFEFDGKKKWKKGRIYNPEDGKKYKADLELEGEILKVRGWIGIRLLGRTVKWTRVQ